jgi:NADPH:quinone reductase-like Zn-dependent oxidoreductase
MGKITATGGKGVEQLNALGADAADGKVDFVFDCVGGETFKKCLPLVREGGRVFTVASNPIPGRGKISCWKDDERAVEMVFFIVDESGAPLDLLLVLWCMG